jgi:pectate lyase
LKNSFFSFFLCGCFAACSTQNETGAVEDSSAANTALQDALTLTTSSYLQPTPDKTLCVVPVAAPDSASSTILRLDLCSDANKSTFTYINHNISTTAATCLHANPTAATVDLVSCVEKDLMQEWSVKNGQIALKSGFWCLSTAKGAAGDLVGLSDCTNSSVSTAWTFETAPTDGGTNTGSNSGEAGSTTGSTAGGTSASTGAPVASPTQPGGTTNDPTLAVTGFAATGTQATGGAKADASHTYTVTSRAQLVAALAGSSSTPKLIYIDGTIEGNVDDNNNPLIESDYAQSGYTQAAYVAAYDPSKWGTSKVPSGTLENARAASQSAQAARIVLKVGSNTSILGVGSNALLHGVNLYIPAGVTNVVVRNVAFTDAYDYFPAWDPTDGSEGNWNSAYDNITIKGASFIWIDHCDFSDGTRTDDQTTTYYGRQYQHHDGLVDITDAADLVTVSYNNFHDHDKGMLIGSSDSKTGDATKLRTTIHHNRYANIIQRQPRVRFGQVHVFNNVYTGSQGNGVYAFSYALGIGISSKIYSESNAFDMSGVSAADIVGAYKGTTFLDSGSTLNGAAVDLNSAAKAAIGSKYSNVVGWSPASIYAYTADGAAAAVADVAAHAGVGKINP